MLESHARNGKKKLGPHKQQGHSRGSDSKNQLRSLVPSGINRDQQMGTMKVDLEGSGPRSCWSSFGRDGSHKRGLPWKPLEFPIKENNSGSKGSG